MFHPGGYLTAVTSVSPGRGIKVPSFSGDWVFLSVHDRAMATPDGNEAGYGGTYFNLSNEAAVGRSL